LKVDINNIFLTLTMKLYVKIALFVVLVIAISGILAGLIMFNKKHTDTSRAKPDFIVTATSLQKEFEDNEKTASAKYINKILEVKGTIASITPADSSNTNISLKTGSDMSSVICTFSKIADPSKFKTGEEITLRGECSGFLMDVLLNNCAVIPNKK
jgi:tRNA_anti-like